MSTTENKKWYDDVKAITERLVRINSVSPSIEAENTCASEIHKILEEQGLAPDYWEIAGDGRKNVWVMLEGQAVSAEITKIPTIILIGHFDTVGVEDYDFGLDPFNPQELQISLSQRYAQHSDAETDVLADIASQNWMFGRGSLDMKSGLAAQIAVIGALAKLKDSLPGNVIMVATPDEEVGSAGIMCAVEQLVRLREERGLNYIGMINSDYTAPREPGDDNRYIYDGTIGKLLPCFYIRGCETHVGEVFRGLDANLIAANLVREIDLNVELCDESNGEITVPPVTLKQRDLKGRYNVQTPLSAVVCFNFLTHSWTPSDVLNKMVALANQALSQANHQRMLQWEQYTKRQQSVTAIEDFGGKVWTYQQLCKAIEEKLECNKFDLKQQAETQAFEYILKAKQSLEKLSGEERALLSDGGQLVEIDSREKSLAIVKALVEIAVRENVIDSRKPAIVVYFAPPYYPHIPGNKTSALSQAVAAVISTGAYGNIQLKEFYPYVSDSSYVKVEETVYESLPVLIANMPLWQDENISKDSRDEYYSIPPLELIHELNCDIVNIGPWGKDAHGKSERVYMPYSFEILPELLYNVIYSAFRNSR